MSVAVLIAAALPAAARADAPATHDGLFLRVGLGVSGLDMQRAGHVSAGSAAYYTGDSSIGGGAGALELTLGGSLAPGLVLAATMLGQQIASPALSKDGGGDVALDGPLHFLLVGASLEYFPDPRGGFHFGGTVAASGAWVKSPPPRFTDYLGGAGGALSVDVGYLWWLSKRWSLGALLRLTGARLHGESTQLGITGSEDDTVRAVTLLFTGVLG